MSRVKLYPRKSSKSNCAHDSSPSHFAKFLHPALVYNSREESPYLVKHSGVHVQQAPHAPKVGENRQHRKEAEKRHFVL
jgi:hypothetical protein